VRGKQRFDFAAQIGIVYENAAHQLRGQDDEMHAFLPTHIRLVDQPHPRFVDLAPSLQDVTWPFLPQISHNTREIKIEQ
jgi:hypothetical protein